MKTLFSRLFLVITLFLSYSKVFAQQVVVNVDEAGTLSGKIAESEKYNITDLKLTGEINGTDITYFRDMSIKGNLIYIDLSEVQIIGVGNYISRDEYVKVANNTISRFMFTETKLEKVNLPLFTTSIDKDAFSFCHSLMSIGIDSKNKFYSSIDGIIYSYDKTQLIRCPQGKIGDVTILSNTINIGYSAFEGGSVG